MSNMMKNSFALVALLLVTTTAIAQVPVLKKPVVLAPQVKPAIPPAMLKTPITVVNPATIVSNSPNREEAARRLKAQNVPVAVALAALSNAFTGTGGPSTLLALRSAGYATPDLVVALKQGRSLSAASMVHAMAESRIPAVEWTPSMRQLYTLDFDTLLAELHGVMTRQEGFGYALDVMGYNVEQMVQTGYRYFNGGFYRHGDGGQAYPGPSELYMLLKYARPIAEHLQVDHYALLVEMMDAGYSSALLMREIKMGTTDRRGVPSDAVSQCVAQTNLGATRALRPDGAVNPALYIDIAPDGSASHSDAERRCFVQFLEKLKDEGASRVFVEQLADGSVYCRPRNNPSCPALQAEVAARMVSEAGYPAEKN